MSSSNRKLAILCITAVTLEYPSCMFLVSWVQISQLAHTNKQISQLPHTNKQTNKNAVVTYRFVFSILTQQVFGAIVSDFSGPKRQTPAVKEC